MMHTRIGIFSLIVSLLFISVSCSKEIDVMSVSLSESSMTLKVGETATLLAVVEPSLADYDGVKWSSSDPSVATVTDGMIQVHKAGTARIIASAGGVVSDICTVTVEDAITVRVSGDSTEGTEPSETVETTESDQTDNVQETAGSAEESEAESEEVVGEHFVYDVDFGEKGSYINIDSLVTVVDWRGRNFNDYPSYWDYYGPFVITVDIKNAECDMNGERQSLPQSVILVQTDPGATSAKDPDSEKTVTLPENRHGYLMCKFSTVGLTQAFNIYVKARIKYGFGTIQTDWITIPVVMDPSI